MALTVRTTLGKVNVERMLLEPIHETH